MSGSASLDLERSLLQHSLAIAPMAALSRVYVALCRTVPTEAAGGTEASGGGYARAAATFALMSSPSNAASNAAAVEFLPAAASWGTIGYFEIWTQPAGGTRLYWGQLIDPADGVPIEMDVTTGDVVRFSAGALVVQAAETATSGGGPWLPLAGGFVTGPTDFAATIHGTVFETYNHRIQALGAGGTMLTPLGIYGELSGLKTGGNNCFARVNLISDTMAAGGAGLTTLLIDQYSGGTGTTGNRLGALINFNFSGGTTNKSLGYGSQYGGQWTYATASGSVGGTAGFGNAYGALWGGVISATLASGSTYWSHCCGLEINAGVSTGASASYVQGLKIALGHHDQATQATDYMLGMAKVYLADVPLGNGIAFGSPDGYWPIAATGTLIGTLTSNLPTPPAMTATNGVDLSGVTFSGAAFMSTGFSVSGVGIVTASAVQTGTTSGPTWTSGTAAPSATEPVGSLYSRVGGAVGATLYVSRGSGTWAAVAGV